MADPKTVSNLPLDVSVRWAKDQQELQAGRPLISESKEISELTLKDASSPFFFSQLESLVNSQNTLATWATFAPPEGFYNQKKQIFTTKILSILETDEQMDHKIQKIRALLSRTENEETKKDVQVFLKVIEKLTDLNKNLIFILSRRTQYQKG